MRDSYRKRVSTPHVPQGFYLLFLSATHTGDLNWFQLLLFCFLSTWNSSVCMELKFSSWFVCLFFIVLFSEWQLPNLDSLLPSQPILHT